MDIVVFQRNTAVLQHYRALGILRPTVLDVNAVVDNFEIFDGNDVASVAYAVDIDGESAFNHRFNSGCAVRAADSKRFSDNVLDIAFVFGNIVIHGDNVARFRRSNCRRQRIVFYAADSHDVAAFDAVSSVLVFKARVTFGKIIGLDCGLKRTAGYRNDRILCNADCSNRSALDRNRAARRSVEYCIAGRIVRTENAAVYRQRRGSRSHVYGVASLSVCFEIQTLNFAAVDFDVCVRFCHYTDHSVVGVVRRYRTAVQNDLCVFNVNYVKRRISRVPGG